ncbi:hypothetical protein GCM10011380_33580 [Sphingomonas metalli]|uniref:Tail specific protease domain-containing protein n=1 Tax=Sphingomonas metalli TaxID=1779358 RepID=A0A916TG98_9SPHN|nr:S41 family peptidase [Sphingomonas metalli]GGB41395.1 hypothetical protein GCM10011380_33580 [Sphingomonas metalli]
MIPSTLTRRTLVGGTGLALTAFALRAHAAAGPDRLSPAAMQGDLAVLRRAYEALHPGLYRYNTPAQIASLFAAAEAATRSPLTLRAFYLLLSRCLGAIRCGHSYANFYNQRPSVAAALFEAPDRLPVDFLWLGEAMVVTADPYATGIVPGSRILSIDGRPAAAVLAALMPLARADGHNDAKRRRLLSVQGDDRYESFDIYFSQLFGRTAYRLTVEDPAGRRRTALVRAVTLAQRQGSAHAGVEATGAAPIWTITRQGDAAILSMPNWGLYDSQWDWRGWLDAAIDRLIAERVPRLIVDLRANEGGLDCGDVLAQRLIARETLAEDVDRLVRYRTLPADLRPYCDTWDRSFDRLGEGAAQVGARFFRLDRSDARIAPRGQRYAGNVRVLIGPQNSSATFQFADFVRRTGIATLVGETTGGNRRGINGGCFYFLRLPGTGLEADLPLVGRFPTRPQPDLGVEPDIAVPVTPADIARGVDRTMERALA